jgi:Rrf2 family protein
MRISEGVEWAVHCCTLLAAVGPGRTLPASRLAEYHEVPPAYLAKHLQALSRAGLVESVPGPRGGYRLARNPAEMTVLDIVEAVEGNEPAFTCTEIRQRGPAGQDPASYARPCGIARAMWAAEDAWRAELAKHTVASLLGGVLQDASREALAAGAKWLDEAAR